MSIALKEIAITTIMNRSSEYWYRDGVIEAIVSEAEEAIKNVPGEKQQEAVIDAIERVVKQYEFICRFDDPCDKWAA